MRIKCTISRGKWDGVLYYRNTVLEEVPLDNKEELRTCGPSFPVNLQEAFRNSTCPRTTLECALLGILDYATHVTIPIPLLS